MHFNPRSWRQVIVSRCLTGVAGLFLVLPAFAQAQYTITPWTIAGGGGTSSAGNYTLQGTLGQTGAGTAMSGGNYALTGGYWVSVPINPSPAPELTITPSPDGQVILSWTPASSAWVLQENSSLSTGEWVDTMAATSGAVVVPVAEAMKFYRLKHVP